ncbi:MAG TPA: hypothetical protein PK299_12175, partial [Anaerolineales bacterium]|nr:hypothetical protein [Anaerolineales bacterium]
ANNVMLARVRNLGYSARVIFSTHAEYRFAFFKGKSVAFIRAEYRTMSRISPFGRNDPKIRHAQVKVGIMKKAQI